VAQDSSESTAIAACSGGALPIFPNAPTVRSHTFTVGLVVRLTTIGNTDAHLAARSKIASIMRAKHGSQMDADCMSFTASLNFNPKYQG